jgi:hypothetical protein
MQIPTVLLLLVFILSGNALLLHDAKFQRLFQQHQKVNLQQSTLTSFSVTLLGSRSSNSHRVDSQRCMVATEINDDLQSAPLIPTRLPSSVGVDYVPLATMLATKDYLAADQFTRDNLIRIAGPDAKARGFVYWTEVKKLPKQDMVTMEKLWLQFSDGNFGYSVQQRAWELEKGNFDNYIRRIGWTTMENGNERKLKWFGANEFIYEVEKAPKGHLPLTSALRGTQLMRCLMEMPLWKEYDWRKYDAIPWEVK